MLKTDPIDLDAMIPVVSMVLMHLLVFVDSMLLWRGFAYLCYTESIYCLVTQILTNMLRKHSLLWYVIQHLFSVYEFESALCYSIFGGIKLSLTTEEQIVDM